MKYHQAYIRMLKVFGSRELLSDQLGFLPNARTFDGDTICIREKGNKHDKYVSRELWRHMRKYYPYSDLRDSYVELINLACDREESQEKETYTGEIEYREKYKKALQNYIATSQGLAQGPKEEERLAKLYLRDEIIEAMKTHDGPEKNVDYYGILKRVAEKEKNGEKPDPEEKSIEQNINNRVEAKYKTDAYRFRWCNSRYEKELLAAGCVDMSDMDFTGQRGNAGTFPQVEAQINAIDMGWPVDELVHIERLQIIMKPSVGIRGNQDTPEFQDYKNRCRTFYNERIKDKKYPATEEARQAFYRDFYELARDSENIIRGLYPSSVEGDPPFVGKWEKFSKGVKKAMGKKLSPVQKVVIQRVQDDENYVLSAERMNAIRSQINVRKRTGHIDSSEFSDFKRTFTRFAEACEADANPFEINKDHGLTPENLELLKKVREAAKVYLKKRDADEKNLDKRSDMGKDRYEGAAKSFSLAHHLILKHEKRLEDQLKEKKEAACVKGRKETREAFFKAGSEEVKDYIEFAKKKAGGEEAYQAQLAVEKKLEDDAAAKEPETEDEKYEKLINILRLKKDAPVVTEANDLGPRVEILSTILAAQESQKAGKPFDTAAIKARGEMIRKVYFMDDYFRTVSQNPNGPNGPVMLRDVLIYPFRAEEMKRTLEGRMYEVRETKYGNTFVAQNKYQADLAEVLSRKRTEQLSDTMKDLVEAINEVMRINLKDNTMVGMNAYKLRKANVRIMKAVHNVLEEHDSFDKDGFAPKLALDTLAVLTTYTGCEPVTRKIMRNLNATKTDLQGQKHNISFDTFTRKYGVQHSRTLAETLRRNANQANNQVNNQANHQAYHPANPVM